MSDDNVPSEKPKRKKIEVRVRSSSPEPGSEAWKKGIRDRYRTFLRDAFERELSFEDGLRFSDEMWNQEILFVNEHRSKEKRYPLNYSSDLQEELFVDWERWRSGSDA